MSVASGGVRRAILGRSNSLQGRLTLLTTVAVAGTLAVTCLVGWVALRITLFDISERGSQAIARDLAPLASRDIAATGGLSARVLGPGTTVVEVVGADGTVLSTPGEDVHLGVDDEEIAAVGRRQVTGSTITASSGETYRVVAFPLGRPDAKQSWVLVVGRPLTTSYEILHVFGVVVLVVGSIGIVSAWLLGRDVTRRALRPVRRLTDSVRHVAETEDLQPLAVDVDDSDFVTLTKTFNTMLERLARSRDQQNRLVDDVSHELRTPLTSMRTNIELLALDARSGRLTSTARTAMLDEVLAQSVEFSDVIADLVHLAREKSTRTQVPVELSMIVDAAIERIRLRCPDVTFDADLHPLELTGDTAGLSQVVANLLDNAVKWTPPGGTVRVRLHGHQLSVADEGPGIADVDLPHVFDRFYRAESARSTPGTGLGLAIAAKVVHDHAGSIRAGRSSSGGAQVTIELPGTTREASAATAPSSAEAGRPVLSA